MSEDSRRVILWLLVPAAQNAVLEGSHHRWPVANRQRCTSSGSESAIVAPQGGRGSMPGYLSGGGDLALNSARARGRAAALKVALEASLD